MKFLGKFTLEHRIFTSILIFLTLCCAVIGFAYLIDMIDLKPGMAFFVGGFIFAMAFLFFSAVCYYFFEKENEIPDINEEDFENFDS